MEEKQTYTRGPWSWQSFGGDSLFLGTLNRGRLVVMDAARRSRSGGGWIRFAKRTDDLGGRMEELSLEEIEGHPDARLIAAAPELLEAFRKYIAWHGPCHERDCPGDSTCNCAGKSINDAANSVIAKAEGVAL